MTNIKKEFEHQGFVGPVNLLNPKECRSALRRTMTRPKPPVWSNANAVSCWPYYQLATKEKVLEPVRRLLGKDVMLWGASLVQRGPGAVHPWHTDVESSGDDGRTVTVWLGLENTNKDSSLHLLSYSHRFGESVQFVAHEAGRSREEVTTDDVLNWAKTRDPRCKIEKLELGDGDALLFDGRLWHFSENLNPVGIRTALLLQYATPDKEIRVPSKDGYIWPFQFRPERPPCILLSGQDRFGINHMVPVPSPDPLWPCWIKAPKKPFKKSKQNGRRSHRIFKGSISCIKKLSSHISELEEGTMPHPPHAHDEEELIIVLTGQIDIIKVNGAGEDKITKERVGPGSVVYHAGQQLHTLENPGPGEATYLIFKWKGKSQNIDESELLSSSVHRPKAEKPISKRPGIMRARHFASPTRYLNLLKSHVTSLRPGAGYPPHRDSHDVAIVLLQGTVETLGRQVGSGSVVFYAAGEKHGMVNIGQTDATYVVFEFHGSADNKKDKK